MKTKIPLLLLVSAFFMACSTGDASEIKTFRLKAGMAGSLANSSAQTTTSPTIKVSFVESCATIISDDALLNIVLATEDGETTLLNLNKYSGMFCSPNDAKITSLWLSTVKKEVFRYDNKITEKNTTVQK